ncbi:MAG: hypothetical protein HY587_08320 [Candidatus Omnitrophica bacterium]|nr:hypothetical protein [Candidatus Omnitrophota bacterium]
MDREVVIAKIRRWKAELAEMIAELKASGKGDSELSKILRNREREIDDFLLTLTDRSHIPRGDVDFEPGAVIEEINAKVKKVREGVQKIKKLSKERKQIIKELGE